MAHLTAGETIQRQHVTILKAIELLQNDLNDMTDKISPETENWKDVSMYAHVADMAYGIIERYKERDI